MKLLISTGFGAGFQTWNTEWPTLHKDKKLIELVENGKWSQADERITEITGLDEGGECAAFLGGFTESQIKIVEVPSGEYYMISEYDGAESLETMKNIMVAE